jgi:uncharacterized protein
MLKFEWDEAKRRLNLKSHNVDFEEAKLVFEDANALEALDYRYDYGEERWQVTGWANDRLLAVVYVERNGVNRIISARLATRQEVNAYAEQTDRWT